MHLAQNEHHIKEGCTYLKTEGIRCGDLTIHKRKGSRMREISEVERAEIY